MNKKIKKIASWYIGPLLLLLLCAYHSYGREKHPGSSLDMLPDSALSGEIQRQLPVLTRQLYCPNSVTRFYIINHYQAAWLRPQTAIGPTWQAMLMLDCTLQFGLPHGDYHPRELMYNRLHQIMERPAGVSVSQQARFEIMLTDAMLTLMNNLHFGKLNPYISLSKQDERPVNEFDAVNVLATGLKEKDFLSVIAGVQPCSADYVTLQQYMLLCVSQDTENCYDVPDSSIRKMAVNLERLRWADLDQDQCIQINIPSYTLSLREPDTIYQYRVVIGKPSNPTPQLNSAISYFTTSPEWKVPDRIFRREILPMLIRKAGYENLSYAIYDKNGDFIPIAPAELKKVAEAPQNYHATQSPGCDNALGNLVFRFPNAYDIFLHDTPEKHLFDKTQRTFSHGCIRVEHADELAERLLFNDKQAAKIRALTKALLHHKTTDFRFIKPVPLRVTYITCSVGMSGLIRYKDVYDLDNQLALALYQSPGE